MKKFYIQVELELDETEWSVEKLSTWFYKTDVKVELVEGGKVDFDKVRIDRVSERPF